MSKENVNLMEPHDYRPALRSSYKSMIAVIVIFIAACVLSFVDPIKENADYLMWMWIVCLVAIAALGIYMWVQRLGVVLSVRPDEVAINRGILARKSTEISYKNLRSIDIEQTLMQRILNIGDIYMASSGTDKKEIEAKNMPNPYAIRDEIQVHERAPRNNPPEEPRSEEVKPEEANSEAK